MRAPAFCDKCGAIFPSGLNFENSTNITLNNVGSGPCPACGGMGHVPDGVYNFIGNTIELLSGPTRTIVELQRLATILEKAKEKQSAYEDVTKEIEEQVPELSSIIYILPKTRTDLYAFIAIIITLLVSQSSSEEPQNIEINNVINNIYQQLPAVPDSKQPAQSKKIGRNEPCPCGSGKKYKHCHGKVI